MGLEAFEYNIYDDDLSDNIELNDIGYLIARQEVIPLTNMRLKTYQKSLESTEPFE